jgi:histidinol-phosphatase (PHP family)
MIDGYYAVDFQVHSFRSHDGKASIAEHCERAVSIGLDEIGFTEHKDFDPKDPVVDHFDYDAYMHEITSQRIKWGAKLKIRAGVEIDYQVWFEDRIGSYLDTHLFDFVMGSVHYVNRVKVMSAEYNQARNARTAYSDYFRAVRDSVVSGLFDVVGHLEYANRIGIAAWGPYDTHAHVDDLTTVFDRMVDRGMALEINTAGLFHGIGATYPCAETVDLYARRGGRSISIGSDAHHPDQLGNFYSTAIRTAQAAGLDELTIWDERRSASVKMGEQPGVAGHGD